MLCVLVRNESIQDQPSFFFFFFKSVRGHSFRARFRRFRAARVSIVVGKVLLLERHGHCLGAICHYSGGNVLPTVLGQSVTASGQSVAVLGQSLTVSGQQIVCNVIHV